MSRIRDSTLAVVVIGGSAKDVGKTALVCAVISALRDLAWTAVKITGHDYEPPDLASTVSVLANQTVWEETNAGQVTDTARYLAAGARRALLVKRHGPEIPIEEIRAGIAADRNIVFESNRVVDVIHPDICLALVGAGSTEMKPSFLRLLRKADALVALDDAPIESAEMGAGIPRFGLQSLEHLSQEMVHWLRSHLEIAQQN